MSCPHAEPTFNTVEDMLKSQHELCVAAEKFYQQEIERKRHA